MALAAVSTLVKGLRMMVNSVFNGWRFEDVWFDE